MGCPDKGSEVFSISSVQEVWSMDCFWNNPLSCNVSQNALLYFFTCQKILLVNGLALHVTMLIGY